MKGSNDLQKDLDLRKYKSNPFEKKYVDLTTSSCIAGCDHDIGLEYLSKTIRTRADIINCQVAHLVKEASNVSENFFRDEDLISNKLKGKSKEKSDDHNDFFAENNFKDESVSLLERLENNPESSLPEEVMSAKLPYLEELVRNLKTKKLKKIILPFLNARGKATIFSESAEQEKRDTTNQHSEDDISNVYLLQHCSTETLLSITRSRVDTQLLRKHLDGHEKETSCSLHKFLRYIKPFSFATEIPSNDNEDKLIDDSCNTIKRNEVMLKTSHDYEGHVDRIGCDGDSIYDYDDAERDIASSCMNHEVDLEEDVLSGGKNNLSFIHDDKKVDSYEAKATFLVSKCNKAIPRAVNFMQLSDSDDSDDGDRRSNKTIPRAANFMQLSDSDDSDDDDRRRAFAESNVREQKISNSKEYEGIDIKSRGKNLLCKMRVRINQSNLKNSHPYKHNDKDRRSIAPINGCYGCASSFDLRSLEEIVIKLPKLLDFHTSQLHHALKTRRVVRVNNANDLLLVIPPLSAPKFSSRTTKREGISWSTIDFIQNASYTAEIAPYDDSKDRYSQTKDTYGRDKRQIDSIQTLSTFPIEIIAFKNPKLALCLPTFTVDKEYNQKSFVAPEGRGTWSPLVLGFGFDQDLRSLFEELRPEEFTDWQVNLQQREQLRGVRDEWEGVADLFLSITEGREENEIKWGWDCSNEYEYEGYHSEEQPENILCVGNTQKDVVDYECRHEREYTFDFNFSDDNCSDNNSERESVNTPAAMSTFKDPFMDKTIKDPCKDESLLLLMNRKRQYDSMDDKNNLHDNSINAALSIADKSHQNITVCKNMPTTSASRMTSELTVISRPLLPVSRIQQLLKGVMSTPPAETLLRLECVIPSSLVTKSYPILGLQEGKLRYSKRVFVSLVFLADGFNRQQVAIVANDSPGNAKYCASSSSREILSSTIQMLLLSPEAMSIKHREKESRIISQNSAAIHEEKKTSTVVFKLR